MKAFQIVLALLATSQLNQASAAGSAVPKINSDDASNPEDPTAGDDNQPLPDTSTIDESLSDEEKDAQIQQEIEALNEKTKKAFENSFDISEDFSFNDIDLYQSGYYKNEPDDVKLTHYSNIMQKGAVS